jgi:integrase
MGVYRPQYKDKQTGEMKHTKTWYYEFIFAGRFIKESAKTTSKTVAKLAEQKRRRELEEGFNGISDKRDQRIRPLADLSADFLGDYRLRNPDSETFAKYALGHVDRLLGAAMAVDISDKVVVKYQTDRLKESAAPKSINEEVGFLLRILPVAQGGAIRAQLRKQKQLKLKAGKRIGKAYSVEEKADLVRETKAAPRSKAVYLGTMLALHAALRHKEIRHLQIADVNMVTRIITVGKTKTEAGSGRTIPMNDDLFEAVVEYMKWYTDRFGIVQPTWYLFPFGKPRPSDPTRPQTTLRTGWKNARIRAKVEGRFHDNRHTCITDLTESGVGDQVIQDMVGHVDSKMIKHYSHIRTEAKRNAVSGLCSKPKVDEKTSEVTTVDSNSGGVPQDVPQVTQVH